MKQAPRAVKKKLSGGPLEHLDGHAVGHHAELVAHPDGALLHLALDDTADAQKIAFDLSLFAYRHRTRLLTAGVHAGVGIVKVERRVFRQQSHVGFPGILRAAIISFFFNLSLGSMGLGASSFLNWQKWFNFTTKVILVESNGIALS